MEDDIRYSVNYQSISSRWTPSNESAKIDGDWFDVPEWWFSRMKDVIYLGLKNYNSSALDYLPSRTWKSLREEKERSLFERLNDDSYWFAVENIILCLSALWSPVISHRALLFLAVEYVKFCYLANYLTSFSCLVANSFTSSRVIDCSTSNFYRSAKEVSLFPFIAYLRNIGN